MLKWLLIAGGGALGSVLRYAMHGCVQRFTGGSFPAGTLAVNVSGCLVIGLIAAVFSSSTFLREEYRIGLSVGVLGGFTTFSAFGLETFALAESGHWRYALLNVLASCVVGLAAVWLGFRLGERWL